MTPRRWEIRGVLGEGSFGAVYLARAVGGGLARDVAIKVLHRDRAESPGMVERLRDEARMLALIRHRAIVRVDDLVELDGAWSIVMEYVEGCDVGTLVRRGPLPPAVALAIAEEVASALHAAWTQAGPAGAPLRLVHRDVKPGNLRLTALGEVKLLDFGVARADFAEREAGSTESAFGTLVYMAPERFEGRDSHEADVYALGVSLFEMLSGVPPGRLATDPGRQPPGGPLAPQWGWLSALSPDLHALVARMLAYDPTQRPTARECARELSELRVRFREPRLEEWAAENVPAATAHARTPTRADARTGTLLIEGKPAPPAPRRPAWVPWALGAAGVVAALATAGVVGGAAWWLMSRSDGEFAAPVTPVGTLPADDPEGGVAGGPPSGRPGGAGDAGDGSTAAATSADASAGAAKAGPPGPPLSSPPPQEETRPGPPPRPRPRPGGRPPPGRVALAGDTVTVVLEGPGGPIETLESVPPGVYVAVVRFSGGAEIRVREVPVHPEATTTLTCSGRFANCTVSGP